VKLPPHSPEAEQALIGCCLTSPVECVPQVEAALSPEAFYDARHRLVWDTIAGLDASAVDIITVQQKLKDAGTLDQIGGIAYLNECQDLCHSTANAPAWIAEVQEKHTRRKVIAACTEAIQDAYESQEDTTVLLDSIESNILKVRPNQTTTTGIKGLVQEAVDRLEYKFHNPDQLGGISTGLHRLDSLTDGIHPGEMIVVAGFPGTGKTALANNIAVGCALNAIPTAIFTAEMRPVSLVVRAMCSHARANHRRLNDSGDTLKRLVVASGKLANRASITGRE